MHGDSNCGWGHRFPLKTLVYLHLQVLYVSDVSTSQYNDLTSQAPLGK